MISFRLETRWRQRRWWRRQVLDGRARASPSPSIDYFTLDGGSSGSSSTTKRPKEINNLFFFFEKSCLRFLFAPSFLFFSFFGRSVATGLFAPAKGKRQSLRVLKRWNSTVITRHDLISFFLRAVAAAAAV